MERKKAHRSRFLSNFFSLLLSPPIYYTVIVFSYVVFSFLGIEYNIL